jgi:glutamate racemase
MNLIESTPKSLPIGVFDSGVGGLAVLKALRSRLPDESFIYVADSGNAPYGDQSSDFILARVQAVASFLVSQGVKAIVVACNTASVVAIKKLRAEHSIPIVAMEPAIKPATLLTQSKTVLVLATSNTIASDSVAILCKEHGANVKILLQACPGLAERVDQGAFHHPETLHLLERYIKPGIAAGADTIVLGCSHYEFLSNEIAAIAGPGVVLVDASAAVARELGRRVSQTVRPWVGPSTVTYYTSGAVKDLSSFLESIGESGTAVRSLPR